MNKLALIILLCSSAFATTKTATGSGTWTTATWSPSGTPTASDDVLINNGVTVTCDTTCAAKTLACTTSGGTCVFNGTSGSFTYHGNVAMGASDWTFSAGFAIVHNDDGVTSSHFTWTSNYAGKLILNGSSGSHVTWGIAPGSGYAGTIGNALGSAANGQLHGTYVDFSDISNTANAVFWQANLNGSGAEFTCANCNFTRTGYFFIDNWNGAANFSVTDSTYTSGNNGPHGVWWFYHMGAKTGGTRAFTGNYWDSGPFTMYSSSDGQDVGMVFQNNFCYVADVSAKCIEPGNPTPSFSGSNWSDVVVWRFDPSGVSTQVVMADYGGTSARTYVLTSTTVNCPVDANTVNYHLTSDTPGIDTTLDQFIFEVDCNSLNASSDFIEHNGSSAASPMLVTNSISLPAPPYDTSGAFATYITGSTPRPFDAHNNTIVDTLSGSGSCSYGFDGAGVAGIYSTLQDNIFWQVSSSTGCGGEGSATSPSNAYNTADHNAWFNVSGTHYPNSASIFVNTPGTGDQTGDPQFVDPTRNFLKFCQSLDASITTWDGCRTKFINRTAGFTPSALIDYVRAGFAPQASYIATMSTTGSYVGAVPPPASSANQAVITGTAKMKGTAKTKP